MAQVQITFIHGIAGSGKTHTLKQKIAALTKQYATDEIVAVSFTKTAAENLAKEYGVHARTLHSLGYEIGGFNGQTILSDKEIDFLMGGFASDIKYQRNQNIEPSQSYLNILDALKGHAFEDLLDFMPVHFNFKVLLIDEAQDMTPLMHAFVAKLIGSGKLEHVIYSGDKMQGIFQFIAAEPDFQTTALRFLEKINIPFTYAQEDLTVSYRIPKIIASFLNRELTHMRIPEIKVPHTAIQGHLRVFNGIEMLCPEFVYLHSKGSSAILCRTNRQAKKLVNLFQKNGFYVRANCRNNLTVDSPKVRAAFQVIGRSLGKQVDLDMDLIRPFLRNKKIDSEIIELADLELTPEEYSTILTLYHNEDTNIIDIYTVHAAKGLEWDTVFYLNDDGPNVFASSIKTVYQLFYVATTRAKNRLFIFNVNSIVGLNNA